MTGARRYGGSGLPDSWCLGELSIVRKSLRCGRSVARVCSLFRSKQTHRLFRRQDSGHPLGLRTDSVQGDAAPRSLRPVAPLRFQSAGQADQARGVGGGGVDLDGVVAVLLVEDREGFGQQGGMRRVVGIVGKPDQDPGAVARRPPGAGCRDLGMVAQDRVASLDRRGQFGLGAADFGGSERRRCRDRASAGRGCRRRGSCAALESAGCPTGPTGRTGPD